MTRRKALAKVRDLKTLAKDLLEAEVKQSRQQVDLAEGRLDSLEDVFRKYASEFLQQQNKGPVMARDLDLFYSYFRDLGRKIGDQQRSVQECRTALEKNQDAVRKAYTEERLLEILHDKLLRQEEQEAEKCLQKETDSAFLSRRNGK